MWQIYLHIIKVSNATISCERNRSRKPVLIFFCYPLPPPLLFLTGFRPANYALLYHMYTSLYHNSCYFSLYFSFQSYSFFSVLSRPLKCYGTYCYVTIYSVMNGYPPSSPPPPTTPLPHSSSHIKGCPNLLSEYGVSSVLFQ